MWIMMEKLLMSVKWVPGIWPYCAATHFTNSKWAHNPTPVNICLIWNMMDQSGIYFAHATPAQLVWHVQNCDWTGLLVSESELQKFSLNFSHDPTSLYGVAFVNLCLSGHDIDVFVNFIHARLTHWVLNKFVSLSEIQNYLHPYGSLGVMGHGPYLVIITEHWEWVPSLMFSFIGNFKMHPQDAACYTPPKRSLGGVYWIHPVRPSVCLSVCPSVRPWVGVRMITLILFSGFKIFFLHISLGSRSCMGLNISVLPH